MSLLFAYMANDPGRVACALHPARALLVSQPGAQAFTGWGIGYHQGGEVLLQRRPRPPRESVDFYAAVRDLRTDALIGHVAAAESGEKGLEPKNENVQPFRFRSWLFALSGTVSNFPAVEAELLPAMPDFLKRNVRGQTSAERLFHLLLASLHELGKLDDASVTVTQTREAVKALVARLRERTHSEFEGTLALTNGRVLVATRRGRPLHLMRVNTLRDCPVCKERAGDIGREPRAIEHEHLRSVCLAADGPGPIGPPWEEVAEDSIVTVSRDLNVSFSPLS